MFNVCIIILVIYRRCLARWESVDTRLSDVALQDAHGGPVKPGRSILSLEARTANFVKCGEYFKSVALPALEYFNKY